MSRKYEEDTKIEMMEDGTGGIYIKKTDTRNRIEVSHFTSTTGMYKLSKIPFGEWPKFDDASKVQSFNLVD